MRKPNTLKGEIGKRLRAVREAAGYSQQRLAELIGVTPQYISNIEHGVVGMSLPTLKHICEALMIPSDRLLFGSREENDLTLMIEHLKNMSPEYYFVLKDFINRYMEAVSLARHEERQIQAKRQ